MFLKILSKIFKTFFFILSLFFLLLFFLIIYLSFREEKVVFNKHMAKNIFYSQPVKIVPSGKIPFNVKIYKSNCNLDIVKYKNRYYFAFRTSPTHFASDKTILYVLSSNDLEKWEYEAEFNFKSDLREPRFLVFKNKLFLYFFQGGTNPLSFAPRHIFVSEYISKSNWTKPKPIYKPGFVAWRVKEFKEKAYMSVYYGVGIYSNEKQPGHLQLLQSDDGYNYKLVNNKEISREVSAEEGEFEFDDKGNLYATIRRELKGSEVCYAEKNDITNWQCKFTPYKYDSALMFKHKNNFYVIARRNIDGKYNKNSKYLPNFLKSKYYLVRYSLTRKRTTLYKLNKEKLELEPLFDFPSKGDTAYAGIVKVNENRYFVLNYSTDIHRFDWNWLFGQLFGSNIYAITLELR